MNIVANLEIESGYTARLFLVKCDFVICDFVICDF